MTRAQAGWWMIGGGLLAIVGGLFLPWVSMTAPLVGTISVYGSEGDGWIVAFGGVLAIIGGLMAKNGNRGAAPNVLGIIGLGLTLLIAFLDFPGLADSISGIELGRLGVGVYAVGAAALGMAVGVWTLVFSKFPDEPPQEPASEVNLSDAERRLRVESIMETEGLSWQQAWNRVERENRTGLSDEDRRIRMEALMETEGLTWQEAWKRTE